MKKKILIVDDEIQILRSFRRLFLESDYEAFFANSGLEALEIIDKEEIDLLITDIRMSNMDGYELMKRIKDKYPKILRIAISGYTDSNKIYEALEDGLAKLYIFKPWDNSSVLNILNKTFQVEEILKNKRILDIINNMGSLPTVPNLYNEITNLIRKEAEIEKITEKIEKDQAIASRILRISNSVYPKKEIGSVKQGIIYLGLSIVKNIVLTNSVFQKSKIKSDLQEFLWNHSGMANTLTLIIYEELLKKKLPNAYKSAGLLHDIGRVVLLKSFNKEYEEVMKCVKENADFSISEVEEKLIGCTHEEIGGYLLDWWQLPYPIVETALFHNNPLDEKVINKELVSIVHISSYYAWQIVNGNSLYEKNLNEDVFEYLKIQKNELEVLIDNFQQNK